MINLPEWRLTLCAPLYDTVSKSPIEMTAQVYAKMRELVNAYNDFTSELTKALTDFTYKTTEDITEFENRITCLMQEHMEAVDSKINQCISIIDEEVEKSVKSKIEEMLSQGVITYNEASEELIVGGLTNE